MAQEDYQQEVEALKKGVGRKLKGCFLAGGAITSLFTNRKIRDYDLYFKDKESFLDALAWMYEDNCWCVSVTPRAITFIENNETVFQLMSFAWFESAEQIFQKFDFTCCMAAIELESGEFIRDKDFIRDLAKREMRFNHGTEFPLGSALRVRKYQDRGYTIADSEYLKVLLACAFKKITNWDELKQQVGGQYGEAMVLDTSKEFSLENAVASLNDALISRPTNTLFDVAASYEEAVTKIFGEQQLAA